MNNRTKISISIFTLAIGSIFISEFSSPANGDSSGAPTKKTGSPGDGSNCTSCHSGTASTQAGLITSTIPGNGYTPGQTYTITGTITTANKIKFGFEISPQDLAGALKGTLVVTNATTTKLITSGKYITHKSTGTSFPSGTATWSFDWIAPPSGSGDLTFYGAFNSTNNNGSSSGDLITLSSLAVSEAPLGIIVNTNYTDNIILYPNPVSDKLYISNRSPIPSIQENMDIDIIDINGKLIKKIINANEYIELKDLAKGHYVLKIKSHEGISVRKIIKE